MSACALTCWPVWTCTCLDLDFWTCLEFGFWTWEIQGVDLDLYLSMDTTCPWSSLTCCFSCAVRLCASVSLASWACPAISSSCSRPLTSASSRACRKMERVSAAPVHLHWWLARRDLSCRIAKWLQKPQLVLHAHVDLFCGMQLEF